MTKLAVAITFLFFCRMVEAFHHRKLILGNADDAIEGRYIVNFQLGVDPFHVLSNTPIESNTNPGENYLRLMDGEPISNIVVLQNVNVQELENLLDDPNVLFIEPVCMILSPSPQNGNCPLMNCLFLYRIGSSNPMLSNESAGCMEIGAWIR